MTKNEFEELVAEEFPRAVPAAFQKHISNLVFIVEHEPSPQLRVREKLSQNQTLLGHYQGIPITARGAFYGVGAALPDTILLFQQPLTELAYAKTKDDPERFEEVLRAAIRETIWHEVAHHFGFNEKQVRLRNKKRST